MAFKSSPRLLMAASLFLCLIAAPARGQETVEKQPKIVLLFDVSASMNTIDGPAVPGQDPARMPSRLDRVVQFLTSNGKTADAPFLDQLLKKAHVTAYRFGSTLDDLDVGQLAGKTWSAEQWARWLKADSPISELRAGTNVAGSALQMLRKEKDNYLQAIVIFSDGRSNRTTAKEIAAFLAEVQDPKRPIPVITIGIGDLAALPSIRIGELQAPQAVRADDKLVVRVPVLGNGLTGAEFQILLEAQRVNDGFGKALVREKCFLPGPKTGKFMGATAELVEFDIDLTKLKKDASDREGTWQFTARVPSHPREAFAGKEHVSEPVRVVVQDRKLRVLLFAGAATREFQFLRSLLHRELIEKRVELAICVQTGPEQQEDVDAERYLKEFPTKAGPKDPNKPNVSLSEYDVVIAFDPDWSKLNVEQLGALRHWVAEHGGGVIFVAGHVFSYQLARPGGHDLSSLLAIYPVVLADSRLHGLGLAGFGQDRTRPYALNFAPMAKRFPFLKLDDSGDSPVAGWNGFFWNDEKIKPEAVEDQRPSRGIFNYYPIVRLKPGSQVVATFAGPKESRIGDKTDAFKDQQPFIVTMPLGAGKTMHLNSGELWRLRGYRAAYYSRLWLGMIRYVARDAIDADRKGGSRVGRRADSVRRPDPELDDVRVEFGKLYQLASKADPLLVKLPAEARGIIDASLRQSAQFSEATGTDEVRWLFFRLPFADAVPMCLEKLPPKQFPKVETPADDPAGVGSFKSISQVPKTLKILVIDGEGAKGREGKGDSFFLRPAVASIPRSPYTLAFGDELVGGGDARKSLERDDLAKFGAIFLLNVASLTKPQLAHLEKYSQQGGGVAFFLGPNVNVNEYNQSLYKDGKGIFPVPLANPPKVEAHQPATGDSEQLLLRDDLFPDLGRYPIFGELFSERRMREPLKYLSVHGHFQVPRSSWQPKPGGAFELATLPNTQPASNFQEDALAALRSPVLKKLQEESAYKKYRNALDRHRASIETVIGPDSESKASRLVEALDDLLLDRRDNLTEFWRNPDPRIREIVEDVVRLRHQARYGDPLVVGGSFGKGRVVAVLTTAGTQWNDFAGGSVASILYPPFIWETADYLTRQDHSGRPTAQPIPGKERPPQLLGVDVNFSTRKLSGKNLPKELAEAYIVTPDAFLAFRGKLADDVGLTKAHWIIQVQPVEFVNKTFGKILPPQPEQQIPMPHFLAYQEKRAYDELLRNVLTGSKDKRWPAGFSKIHDLETELSFDFRQHLGRLKAKNDDSQEYYLVKLWISAASSGPKGLTSRSAKPFVFLVVSEMELRVEADRAADHLMEKLEGAKEKVGAALSSLDDQISRLKDANTDLEIVTIRVADIRTILESAANNTRALSSDYARFVVELERNRASKEAIAQMDGIAISLANLSDQGFVSAEDALNKLTASLESGKRDKSLDEARAAQGSLKNLDEGLMRSLEKIDVSFVERKLRGILLQIEKSRPRRGDNLRERERLDRLIEDLLPKSPNKKK